MDTSLLIGLTALGILTLFIALARYRSKAGYGDGGSSGALWTSSMGSHSGSSSCDGGSGGGDCGGGGG
jgi:hypothetical protein